MNPVFALESVRNVSGLFKESLIAKRTYITFGYEFVLFVLVGKRSLYVFPSNSFCNHLSYG